MKIFDDNEQRRLDDMSEHAFNLRHAEKPKRIFEWCNRCKYVGTCYDDETGRGPNYLEPACGEGPA